MRSSRPTWRTCCSTQMKRKSRSSRRCWLPSDSRAAVSGPRKQVNSLHYCCLLSTYIMPVRGVGQWDAVLAPFPRVAGRARSGAHTRPWEGGAPGGLAKAFRPAWCSGVPPPPHPQYACGLAGWGNIIPTLAGLPRANQAQERPRAHAEIPARGSWHALAVARQWRQGRGI